MNRRGAWEQTVESNNDNSILLHRDGCCFTEYHPILIKFGRMPNYFIAPSPPPPSAVIIIVLLVLAIKLVFNSFTIQPIEVGNRLFVNKLNLISVHLLII